MQGADAPSLEALVRLQPSVPKGLELCNLEFFMIVGDTT
jgi:hypothetical protein